MADFLVAVVQNVRPNTDPQTGASLGGAYFTVMYCNTNATLSGGYDALVTDITVNESQIQSGIKTALVNYVNTNFGLGIAANNVRLI